MMRPWRNACLPWSACLLLFFTGSRARIEARRVESLRDDQVRELVELTVKKIPSGETLNIRRRQDLEEILLTLEANKTSNDVYFYEIHSPPGTISEAPSVWVVAVARSSEGVYKLYSFDGSAGADAPSQEFNRFTSQLTLSIPEKRAIGLARLFLASYLEGDAEETVLNDAMELRLAVQDYYLTTYGDVWRALDADSRWWQGFRPNALAVAPTIRRDDNGRYRVILEKLLTFVGKHPQVQEWQLEISREGKIRVVSMQLIFPDSPSWLFYDRPSPLRNPPFENPASPDFGTVPR
jgi:hypothetical protein